ncbi:radical SAM protein [Desulfurispira natronophila]|uniref:Radical SAM superfamily enzyme YgiQ (UPF0313 family) n=1 Tax=Desulfurispira natronophila TaxID=682562 RepID=A0A7W7Y6A1_9BACT|nr:radical SAM protein [Desulfurispira natronophila]MBB5022886.1 radical SAM superfamily enzyme YgiQ (UPF0313 family) [Desulfurispira natronophila]
MMPDYTQPLYRPPSEARSLIFQITHGCSHNDCTFCGMYLHKPFRLKPLHQVLEEIRRIPADIVPRVRRIFLADGDAVIYPQERLLAILDALNAKFPTVQRISAYVGRKAMATKTPAEWGQLRQRKLSLLYFGLESANDQVTDLMNKGRDADFTRQQAITLQEQGIALSVMVILGGGGQRLSREHALDTARWATAVNPRYLSLLTLFLRRKQDFFDSLEPPTLGSLLDEAQLLIENIDGKNIIFRANHISNLVTLSGTLPRDRDRLLQEIARHREQLGRQGRLDEVPEFYEEF